MYTINNKTFFLVMLIVFSALIINPTFAQNPKDTTTGSFQDDFLDHLVGKWNITSVAHGFSSTAVLEAEWVLNHQFLYYHFAGNDTIPWIHKPMEFECYISYNYNNKRYVVLGMSVFGVDDFEGFSYGSRNGNELKIVQKGNNEAAPTNIQRYIWEPASNSWSIQSRPIVAGKEGEVFLDMKLVPAQQ